MSPFSNDKSTQTIIDPLEDISEEDLQVSISVDRLDYKYGVRPIDNIMCVITAGGVTHMLYYDYSGIVRALAFFCIYIGLLGAMSGRNNHCKMN